MKSKIDAKIEIIIGEIEPGVMFDSHYVINALIKDYSDEYMHFIKGHFGASGTTEHVHGEIAKHIRDSGLVTRIPGDSLSYNIRCKSSRCALWKRVPRPRKTGQ